MRQHVLLHLARFFSSLTQSSSPSLCLPALRHRNLVHRARDGAVKLLGLFIQMTNLRVAFDSLGKLRKLRQLKVVAARAAGVDLLLDASRVHSVNLAYHPLPR